MLGTLTPSAAVRKAAHMTEFSSESDDFTPLFDFIKPQNRKRQITTGWIDPLDRLVSAIFCSVMYSTRTSRLL